MIIKRIQSNLLASNMYIIEEGKHAIIIDPCTKTDSFRNGIQYDWIFLTHEHIDHISGVPIWQRISGAKVMCIKECARNIKDPNKNMSHYFNVFCDLQQIEDVERVNDFVCEADIICENGHSILWQNHVIEIIHIPGHSQGSSLIVLDSKIIFSGDSLFKECSTECRYPGGSRKKWEEVSVPIINKISLNAIIYPGHYDCFILKERNLL